MPETDAIPVSASVASTGLGIRYIGDWAYAYSGLYISVTSENTELDFTSGSGIIVGTVQLNNPVDDDNPSLANVSTANIKFNGISIAIISGSSTDAGTNRSVIQKVVIPPLTRVIITVVSNGNEADRYGSLILTGRVYGAE